MEIEKNPQKKNPHVPKNGTSKKKKIFFCEVCDYNTSNKKDFKKHFSTKKHGTKWYMKFKKSPPFFLCEDCEFITCCMQHFLEHKKECQSEKKSQKNPQISKVEKTEKKKLKNENVEHVVEKEYLGDIEINLNSSSTINGVNKNMPKNAKTTAKKNDRFFPKSSEKSEKTEKKKLKIENVEHVVKNDNISVEDLQLFSSIDIIYQNENVPKNAKTLAEKVEKKNGKKFQKSEKTEKKKLNDENVEHVVEYEEKFMDVLNFHSSDEARCKNENMPKNAKTLPEKVEIDPYESSEKNDEKKIKVQSLNHEVENVKKIVDTLILNQSSFLEYAKKKGSKNAKSMAKNENICNLCGKEYKYPQGLYRHRKKCGFVGDKNNNMIDDSNTLLDIVIKTQNQLIESQEQTKELCNEIIKLKDTSRIINNTYNQNVNINLFLNEECKDAMNLTDFLSKIQMTLADLAYTKNNGMIKGITNIVIKNLEETPPTERPIHSIKDEEGSQLYIKEDNTWGSENEKGKIEKSIDAVSKKQLNLMKEWEKQYPDWNKTDKGQEEYMEICRIILGGTTESDLEKTRDLILERIPETNVTYGKDDLIE